MSKRGVSMPVTIGLIAVGVIAAGVWYGTRGTEDEEAMMEGEWTEEEMEAMEGEHMEEEGMMQSAEGYSGNVLAGTSALLLDFKKADYEAAKNTDKLIVLYFYANWCPICKVEFPKLQAVFNDFTTDEVIGFRVNYNDNETDADEVALAREFGVAYQHTKVLLRNGARILKAPDSWDKARYTREIMSALAP